MQTLVKNNCTIPATTAGQGGWKNPRDLTIFELFISPQSWNFAIMFYRL
jgi:hypothetical protein